MPARRLLRTFVPAACSTLLACADSTGPGGTLEVSTVTTGPSGTGSYTLGLDGGTPAAIGPTATRYFTVEPGEHEILLGGLPGHCAVSGSNPRTLRVTAGQSAVSQFDVACSPTATVVVTTPTVGESRDPNGYVVSLAEGDTTRMAIDAETSLTVPAPARYTVTLADVAPNCTVDQGATRQVTMPAGAELAVRFEISCTFVGAVQWDTIPLPLGFEAKDGSGSAAMWGTSSSDLFVIGDVSPDPYPAREGAILHYDGQQWTQQTTIPGFALAGIAGTSATDVFVIANRENGGNDARILHYDGSQWTDMPGPVADPSRVRYLNIWHAASGEILLVGTLDGAGLGLLARYDGTAWSRLEVTDLAVSGGRDASGTSSTDIWTIDFEYNCDDCTSLSSFVGHWDGVQTSVRRFQFSFHTGILAFAPDDVWVVGDDYGDGATANVAHWDGATWTEGPPIPDVPGLWDVWASSRSDMYAVGRSVLLRFDGSGWSIVPGIGGSIVWGPSRDHVYVLYRDYNVDRDFMIHGRP
jgi:hypothetical protein